MGATDEVAIQNPPGQAALSYRVRTYATSFAALLADLPAFAIPSGPNAGTQPLAALTTRAPDDPTIGILDAWAMVIDVLAFYQERIANEGYLRTATELLSVQHLVRAVGYELNPGLAATAYLAFQIDSSPGSPGQATVPQGTQVQSVPGQGQLPQTFETTQAIQTRAAWNALSPLLVQPQWPSPAPVKQLVLQGTSAGLLPGALLWVASDATLVAGTAVHVAQATIDPVAGTTTVALFPGETVSLSATPTVLAFRQQLGFFGRNTPVYGYVIAPIGAGSGNVQPTAFAPAGGGVISLSWASVSGATGYNVLRTLSPNGIAIQVNSVPVVGTSFADSVIGQTAAPGAVWFNPGAASPNPWLTWVAWGGPTAVDLLLERSVTGIVAGSVVVLVDPTGTTPTKAYVVARVVDAPIRGFGFGGQTTALNVGSPSAPPAFSLDGTMVWVQSQALPLAPTVPGAGTHIMAATVTLDHEEPDLAAGQLVALTGELTGAPGTTATEVMTLAGATSNTTGQTVLSFTETLHHDYAADSVTLNANVAPATHGQTVAGEVLGSGDGSQSNQVFFLSKTDLTYVPAATPTGSASTLSVSVNGVPWHEVPTLYGQAGQAQCYAVREDDTGRTAVIFGDGTYGARLPTGQENVTATYRTGIGASGDVAAGTLLLLQNRPLGVSAVNNPLPAGGGADLETIQHAQTSAPLTIRTLGRIVTLSDYQDFAAAFPGIGKALVTLLEGGGEPLVHLTVAGLDGAAAGLAAIIAELSQAITAAADPTQPFVVDPCQNVTFGVVATLYPSPGADGPTVQAAATQALLATFGFAARSFAQPVRPVEIMVALQRVAGVTGVMLASPTTLIAASSAGFSPHPTMPGQTIGAELLLIDPTAVTLTLAAS